MRIVFGPHFHHDYAKLDVRIQRQVDKQIRLILENPRHHSLRIHKMGGYSDIYEARVTKGYRFTFQISGDAYIVRRVGTHNILKTP